MSDAKVGSPVKLHNIEMFKDLSNMELAKLLGMLEKQYIPTGAPLFDQGDPGDKMFIIEQGAIELFVSAEDGTQHSLAMLSEGEVLGEMALLTGETRSASAVAAADTSLFVIDRRAFDRLIAENHVFSSYFIKLLSKRLKTTNSQLQSAKEDEADRVLLELGQMPEHLIHYLVWCAYIPVITRELADHSFNFSMPNELATYPYLQFYFVDNAVAGDHIQLQPKIIPLLQELGKEKFNQDSRRSWLGKASAFYEAKGEWLTSIQLQGKAGHWEGVLGTYVRAAGQLKGDKLELLSGSIQGCPRRLLAESFAVLSIYLPYCEEHNPGEGLSVLELALNRNHTFSPSEVLFLYERGMELYRRAGMKQQAMEYMQLADGAISAMAQSTGSEHIERSYGLEKQRLTRRRSELLAQGAASLIRGNRAVKTIAVVAALLLITLSFILEPIGGLSQAGMRFTGIALAAVLMWIVDIIPNYITALIMIMLWVLGGVAPPEVALSGFASGTWLFMVFIMAISAVITKSGISYRFALHALKRFPSHYRGQLWGIVAGGVLLNPLLPSSSAKASLGVPIAHTLAESLGYEDRSKGAAGLGLTAMIFFGFTAPFVMTGSYTNIMAYGLVDQNHPISWLQWLVYALPAFLLFSAVMLAVLFFMFRKIAPVKPVSSDVLDEQLKLLGPLTRDEKTTLSTVLGCIILMIMSPLHGIDSTWIMLVGFAVLIISGVLDKATLSGGIDWTFLLFLGAAFSFANVADQLGIADLLSTFLEEHLTFFLSSPLLFLVATVLVSFLVTLVVRDDPAVILLVTALVPLGTAAGIHPWILIFIILLSTDPFFFSYQSPTYLTAYYSTEGKAFTHRQAQKAALGYGLAVLLIAIACVPYWKWLQLIP